MLNPGDPKATDCKCPRDANQGGQGTFNSVSSDPKATHFVVHEDCPLHGKTTWREAPQHEGAAA